MDTFCSAHITNRAITLNFNPVKPNGHYMYRQWSLYVSPVATICTASGHYMYHQWSLCTASGHYMYRQWSLYVSPVVTICITSGHYMYRQWSLYVPPMVTICIASGHYMYRQWSLYVPPGLTFTSSTFCPYCVFLYFVWFSEQKAIISLYNIN
jgi:hypothetical protein